MKLQTPSDLARLVKNARVQRNLTQQDVANAVGITRQSLARLERGNGAISFDTVLLILDHLGIRLDATTDRRGTGSAQVATRGAAQAAADALVSIREGSRGLTERLTIPGSVLINPPRAVEAGAEAAATARADTDVDAARATE